MEKKKNSLLKSLKRAAVIAFGGVAILGGGFAAQKAVSDFNNPPPATDTIRQYAGNDWQDVQRELPQGDGHPVLVIPGFITNDFYMSSLRSRIAEQGYRVYGWEQGMNLGASREDAEQLALLLKQISAENGGRKVSLVGYSLGGVYAREMAKQYPDLVRDVITLGAPSGLRDANGAPNETLSRIHEYFGQAAGGDVAQPPAVPTTSVYARHDYIVDWHASRNAAAPRVENIQVDGGHVLLPFNSQATAVVLDRLAQPEENWQPLWKGALKP